jgi:hypothetical protein
MPTGIAHSITPRPTWLDANRNRATSLRMAPHLRPSPVNRNIMLRRSSLRWLMPNSHKRQHHLSSNSNSRPRLKLRRPLLDSESAQHLRNRSRTLLLPTPSSILSSSILSNTLNKCSSTPSIRNIPSNSTPSIFSSSNNSSSSTKLCRPLPSLTRARPSLHLHR